jgi:hypothetical protein
VFEERGEQASANALAVMRLGDSHFVHPELGWLVGVPIVNARRHPDHAAIIDCDGEMMPRVGEELGAPSRMDLVVEHVGRDVVEHVSFIVPQYANRCHSERSACPEERQRREGGILGVPVERLE